MTDLEVIIQRAAQAYYTDGSSNLSDAEFDALVDQLRRENPDSLLFRVGWGYDISGDTTPGKKRKHLYTTIGSLEKCHDLKELGKDLIGVLVDASTKLDGLSCVLYYENGMLKYALTRGDSFTGIDITDKVLKINPDFAMTSVKFTGAIRGEIVMSFKNFEIFQREHADAKNPRNSTAGLINGKDTFEDLKYLDIILYTLVHDDVDFTELTTVNSTRSFLRDLFRDRDVKIVLYTVVCYPDSFDFGDKQFLHEMDKLKNLLYEDYPADGIVLSKEDITCNHGTFVYTAKAFKFPAESKPTTIIDVEWNMSKTKNAVPRILLEPIQLSGTNVQACTGYNAQYIKENNLGPGSIVEVMKSGEIIPNIVRVLKSTQANLPTVCPECGEPLSWSGVHLVCTNIECSNSVEQDLLVWLQNLVPTDNLGDTLKMKFLNQMVENGNLEDVSIESVMRCKMLFSEDTPSTQFNTFAKMWNNLRKPEFKFDLVRALIACNIPRIGDLTAIKFANYPDKIQDLLDSDDNNLVLLCVDLMRVFGEANTLSVQKHIHKLKRLNLIRDRILWKTEKKAEFRGKVAITGTLSVKRSEFEKELRLHGYEPTDTINKDTAFLVTDNPNGQSSKNLKAAKLGIQKISEYEFRLKYLN